MSTEHITDRDVEKIRAAVDDMITDLSVSYGLTEDEAAELVRAYLC